MTEIIEACDVKWKESVLVCDRERLGRDPNHKRDEIYRGFDVGPRRV
jgi:hypothetical protein